MRHLLNTSLLLLCVIIAQAQPTSGIYLSAEDFDNNKLSCSSVPHHKFRFRLNELFSQPDITVINNTGKRSIPKDSVFGYRNEGVAYRLYGRESYEVLNAGMRPLLYKRAQMHGGRDAYSEVTYYFSKGAGSPILPLSRSNIGSVYRDDKAFVESVYENLNTDRELIAYDAFHQLYKLNRLYQKLHASNL